MKRIKKLAHSLKETEESIVERAVGLLENELRRGSPAQEGAGPIAHPASDPQFRAAFSRYMSATIKRTNAKMSAAEKKARGEAGAAARAKKLSPEERKKIASDAAKKRWANKQPKAD